MGKFLKWWLVGVSVVCVLLLTVILLNVSRVARDTQIGLEAVKYMYHFSGVKELDDNMDKLRSITTEDVYQRLTIDNTDRVMRVYLKFNNNPTKVIVDKATDSYVTYSLDTDSISATRKFVFFFHVNRSGDIDYVRESEVVDFVGDN